MHYVTVFSEPSGSSGWRGGGRSERFAAREGGERERREEGGEVEKTWDIKGNLGWEKWEWDEGRGEGGGGGRGGRCVEVFSCKRPEQTNRMFVSGGRRGRVNERVEQDGCHLLIYSWAQPYRDVAGGCTVDVHKGLEAKCGKYNIDLECIWKVIWYLISRNMCSDCALIVMGLVRLCCINSTAVMFWPKTQHTAQLILHRNSKEIIASSFHQVFFLRLRARLWCVPL